MTPHEREINGLYGGVFRTDSATASTGNNSISRAHLLAAIHNAVSMVNAALPTGAGNTLSSLGGLKIFENPNCTEKSRFPRKTHELKHWMGKAYHNRIQKKWNKRWGYEMKPVMYVTQQGVICHPTIAQRLIEQIHNL